MTRVLQVQHLHSFRHIYCRVDSTPIIYVDVDRLTRSDSAMLAMLLHSTMGDGLFATITLKIVKLARIHGPEWTESKRCYVVKVGDGTLCSERQRIKLFIKVCAIVYQMSWDNWNTISFHSNVLILYLVRCGSCGTWLLSNSASMTKLIESHILPSYYQCTIKLFSIVIRNWRTFQIYRTKNSVLRLRYSNNSHKTLFKQKCAHIAIYMQ